MNLRPCLFPLLALLATSVFAQQDFSKVEIKATQVAKNVYMLEGSGGNIGVSVGPDGILIVDDQFAPLADKIAAALQQLNPGKLKFVLNTHHHGDHTGGNAAFGAKDAAIIAQTNVRLRLVGDAKTPHEALPVVTFDRSASVHFNGEEITLRYLGPAHTNGDTVIQFTGANVIHMGDQFMTGRFPFIDFSSGGDLDGLIKNLHEVIAQAPADVKIIPGHGRLATLQDLKDYLDAIEQTAGIVRKEMAEGKTLEQLRVAGLPEQWKSWGTGFINTNRWIETIYNQSHKDAPKQ